MTKSFDEIKQEIEIGEKILIAANIIKFGTKPGYLDKMLGEEDVRRMVIDGENVDRESDEYKKRCQKAYKNFRKKFKNDDGVVNEEDFSRALEKVDKIYDSRLNEAEEKDKVNWVSVGLNSLMLGATATEVANKISKNSDQKQNSKTSSDLVLESHLVVQDPQKASYLKEDIKEQNMVDASPSYLESATQTFNDAINYLTEKSGGIPYGMLMFGASLSQNQAIITAGVAAAMLSTLPESEAIKVGNKDYKTTVYCGPEIGCNYLEKFAKAKNKELIQFDKNQRINSQDYKAYRVIFASHGNADGRLLMTENGKIKPDSFIHSYFPNAKICHAFGCRIGANTKENFGENVLEEDQILFLHAGNNDTRKEINLEKIFYFLSGSNQTFYDPEPLQIIFKKNETSSIITSLVPTSLEEIKSLIDSSDKIDLVEKIYNLIEDNNKKQKKEALEQLKNIPKKSKNIINGELKRFGFVDSKERNLEEKEILVKEYISRMILIPKYSSDINSNLELFLGLGLFDVNYQFFNGATLVHFAAENGNIENLSLLAKAGANLNKTKENGETPAFIAAQNGHTEVLRLLAKYSADLNKAMDDGATPAFIAAQNGHTEVLKVLDEYGADLNIPKKDDVTPAFIATQIGNKEALRFLAENSVDLNKATKTGATPACIAAKNEHLEVLKVLAEYGANFNIPTKEGATPLLIAINAYKESETKDKKDIIMFLVENGADPGLMTPVGSAYEFSSDEGLNKEMAKASKKYLAKNPPKTSIKNSKVEKIDLDRYENEL